MNSEHAEFYRVVCAFAFWIHTFNHVFHRNIKLCIMILTRDTVISVILFSTSYTAGTHHRVCNVDTGAGWLPGLHQSIVSV